MTNNNNFHPDYNFYRQEENLSLESKNFYNRVIENVVRRLIKEGIYNINESFKSNTLRDWFKQHGGVKKVWDEFPDRNVPQDGLGDVTDGDIVYTEEFDNIKDAREQIWRLQHERSDYGRKRSEREIKTFYTMYMANDGSYLIVGLDRGKVETGINWGGEYSKKKSDRVWRDDRDPRSFRAGKYIDDKDTYYYSQKGQDFGVYTNRNFNDKQSYNNKIKSKMSDEEWNNYQKMRINHMDNYLKNHYKKGLMSKNRTNM